ncbi:MAG: GNAT family N-acetyltransferase [Anaerolineales bacterium]|nr:GNAT family N-acetyltransferase [Anaerolineales bacterium]
MPVLVRPAETGDVPHILAMVNRFADQNIMLPRTVESVSHTLPDWLVAVEEWPEPTTPPILACGALVPLTDTLAEVRSLAVHESQQGQGLGGVIVLELVQRARIRNYEQVCALTLRENFFVRLGFSVVDRWSISSKVWQACIYCRKFHRCDEVAVLMNLAEKPATTENAVARPGWSHLLKWSEWQPLKLAYKQPTMVDDR